VFTAQAPSGPSAGSGIDHIAFKVPDLQPVTEKLGKTAYKNFRPAGTSDRVMVDGPDGVRIELIEDSSMYAPLQFDHIHINAKQPKETMAWYASAFGARSGPDDDAETSHVGGATLSFAKVDSVLPTAGRAIDHIAFEVKGLEAFCKKLGEDGIKLDSPYLAVPELKMSAAYLTDPWGTRIELTEGLAP
jgi:catechol 2,3-dioxygenase-like lactoylglutathione lyase family enzyme